MQLKPAILFQENLLNETESTLETHVMARFSL